MYYVIEHQIRPDGVVNTSEVGRTTFASALSLYYERASKLVMSEIYTSAHLMLVDEELNVLKFDHINTIYKPQPQPEVEEPKEEPTPEPTPEPEPEAEEEAEEEDGTTAEDE